jgi:sugar (pentulose or hexulose) kinase
MTIGQKWLIAALVSGCLWLGMLYPLMAAKPPACTATQCPMYGPGGYIRDWRLSVMLADLKGLPIVVPAGRTCASACALAVGFALAKGYDVRISPSAVFVPHNREAISKGLMPKRFKALMRAYRPFRGSAV